MDIGQYNICLLTARLLLVLTVPTYKGQLGWVRPEWLWFIIPYRWLQL